MNNAPILLTDRITRTRYKRVGSHWSESTWASWGLAGLILASLVVFGMLGCQKPAQVPLKYRLDLPEFCADPQPQSGAIGIYNAKRGCFEWRFPTHAN